MQLTRLRLSHINHVYRVSSFSVPLSNFKIITKLRPASQVVTLSRNLSTFYHCKKPNLTLSHTYILQNSSFTNSTTFIRHQSTVNTINANATTTNISDKVVSNSAENVQNSVHENNSKWINNADEPVSIPDAPLPVEEIVQALSANGEPTFASLGMCNYTPVGLIQYIFEWLHVSQNLPWWTTIAVSTLVLRLLMFPLVIKSQKNAINMSQQMPHIQYLTEKMTEARKAGDMYEASLYGNELMVYTKNHNFNPIKSMLMPMIQAPVFLSMFLGLRKMANNVDSMKEGGLWWFTDLSTYDPYYVLPVLTSISLFVTIELGSDSFNSKVANKTTKYVLRAIPVVMFPFTLHFEGAILLYWVCNNFISLGQVAILKIPKVRNYFEIPVAKVTKPPPNIKKGFKKGFEDTIQNFRIAREMRERENFNQMQFRNAGKGPLVKTFDYNPKVSSNNKTAILRKQQNS